MRHVGTLRHMTTAREERIPALTLGWRLKMALGDMKRSEMADHLGVDPGTLSRWMADKGAPPKRVYIVQWAMMTGVSVEWLEKGQSETDPTPPDGGRRTDALDKLTQQKMGRSRQSPTTHRYLLPAAA